MAELPIARPGKIIAVGLNYRDHAAESAAPPPESPILFAKWSTCLVPHGAPVVLPVGVDRADYEAELAVVIGRRAKGVPADDALDVVSGYVAMNDVSDREAQAEGRPVVAGQVLRHVRPVRAGLRPGPRDPGPAEPRHHLRPERSADAGRPHRRT